MNNTFAINNHSYDNFSFLSSFFSKLFLILGICAIIGLTALSVMKINALTQEIYTIQTYEKKIAALAADNKQLEIKYAKTNSSSTVEEKTKEMELEKIAEIHYIKVSGEQVAKNFQVSTP